MPLTIEKSSVMHYGHDQPSYNYIIYAYNYIIYGVSLQSVDKFADLFHPEVCVNTNVGNVAGDNIEGHRPVFKLTCVTALLL